MGNIALRNGQFLFVGAKSLYIKDFYILNCKLNVNICIFFYNGNKKLILEVKKKNIPIIGLIPIKSNRLLIDYPIIINSLYFHSVFLFSKVLFKLIFLTKS